MTVALWRDHDPDVLDLPGIAVGRRTLDGTPAATLAEGWYREGIRRVAIDQVVDLAGGLDAATLVRLMVLLRELTSWGIVVDWRLRLGAAHELWRRFNHLHPPAELVDHPDPGPVLAQWRDEFYLGKCIHRHGPGFVQVRDRRAGELARFTIDDPEFLAAVEMLQDGAPADAVPAHVLDAFLTEGLAGLAGDLAWWLPYRVRRWPWPALMV